MKRGFPFYLQATSNGKGSKRKAEGEAEDAPKAKKAKNGKEAKKPKADDTDSDEEMSEEAAKAVKKAKKEFALMNSMVRSATATVRSATEARDKAIEVRDNALARTRSVFENRGVPKSTAKSALKSFADMDTADD